MSHATGFPSSGPTEPLLSGERGAKFTVAGVARRLGVAPGTLRTWDRRYGVGPSEHCAGEHRKYSEVDLARLVFMHKLIVSGVGPAQAASSALAMVVSTNPIAPTGITSKAENVDNRQTIDTLYRTVHSLDRHSVDRLIRHEFDTAGIAQTWNEILVPLLIMVGNDWVETGGAIEMEHMLSEIILSRLSERISVSTPINPNPVLLACLGEESHSLAITALAATLAEDNIHVQFLGARTPIIAICEVAKRSAPPAIFLWAQLEEHADSAVFSALPVTRPAPRVILGGPGWSESTYGGARIASNLMEAHQEICSALGI